MTHKSSLKNQLIFKGASQWVIILTVGAALFTGTATLYSLSRFQIPKQSPAPTPKASTSAVRAITALGRLEPEGEVIHLSAPASAERTSRVDQLLVKQGDRVRSGQVIAILDSRDRLTAALKQAGQQVKVAQARLAQVKAGAKTGEITAQKATISRLEAESRGQIAAQKATIARLSAELRNAETEFRRYQQLYQNGAISASNIDSKRLTVETIQQQINEAKATLNRIVKASSEQTNEAKATLNRIASVRSVDVQAAQAEVDSAIAAVERAQADLNLAYVRASINGQILKIHTWPGEVVGDKGITELGRTNQMYVVAEVYETDVGKVRLGQQATITSQAFAGKLRGNVAEIGLQIDKKDILNTDPAADVDARVVEVKIRLNPEDSKLVAALTRLQVKVAIDI
jgi:HlyD family secretion protein